MFSCRTFLQIFINVFAMAESEEDEPLVIKRVDQTKRADANPPGRWMHVDKLPYSRTGVQRIGS